MSRRRATIRDVATSAGVSISTVSYALSGKRSVPLEVRTRIQEAITELNYQPHASARALRQMETKTLAILGTPLNEGNMELVNKLVNAAADADYDLLVTPIFDSRRVDRLLQGRRVDGVILMDVRRNDARIKRIRTTDIPFVSMGRPYTRDSVALVDVDYVHMVGMCVHHLADLGHRELALMNNDLASMRDGFGPSRDALTGFEDTANELGLTAWADCCEYDAEAGEAWTAAMLAAHPKVTAVVTVNERAVRGLYRGLRIAGRAVPRDISVVGMGSSRWATSITPEITGTDLPFDEQARATVQMLVDRIRDPQAPVQQLVIKPSITTRASAAPPPPPRKAAATKIPATKAAVTRAKKAATTKAAPTKTAAAAKTTAKAKAKRD
jgi:DNA-binding LacI/PurR family transcriptional regulator